MLIFIDESGDTGLKLNKGSSKYFVITLITFEDNEEALGCDKEIYRKMIGTKEIDVQFWPK